MLTRNESETFSFLKTYYQTINKSRYQENASKVGFSFVDGFIAKNYPGKEAEMFDKLSKSQPIGRMGKPDEIAALALYLCSEEAGFITGCDYPIDGGFIKLNN